MLVYKGQRTDVRTARDEPTAAIIPQEFFAFDGQNLSREDLKSALTPLAQLTLLLMCEFRGDLRRDQEGLSYAIEISSLLFLVIACHSYISLHRILLCGFGHYI